MPDPNLQDNKTGSDQLNPSAQHYEGTINSNPATGLKTAEQQAVKDTQRNSADSIDSQEKNPLNGISAIPTSYTGAAKKVAGKMTGKKKGGIIGIIVFILGIVGIGGTMFTPGLGIVQMKEMLTGNLNDQLAAMDIRSDHVFRAKLSNMSTGVCTGVQIKCKFSSMTQKQVDRFKNAGFTIADDDVKSGLFGRKVITSMTAPDGTIIKNPADLLKARNENTQVRSAMKRVFNPVYYGLSDKVANEFFNKNKTGKQKKITGTSEEERKQSVTDATSGERAQGGGVLTDSNGSYLLDENNERVYEADNKDDFDRLKQEADAKSSTLNDKSKIGGKAVNGIIGGVGRGVSIIGAADTACTVYNTARAVSAAAKVARSMQLIQFAMVINTTADSIKAGDATPEEVEIVGNMLANTDTRKTIQDQSGNEVENPFYKKSAYDSPGYKTVAYNDAPILTPQSQQYMVGGGISGTLSNVIADVEQSIGAGSPQKLRESCGFIQSPWVRGAGLVVGVFLAIGSMGITTALSVTGSIVASFALPFLESALADIVAGTVVSGDTVGVEAGDAAMAGTAAMLGGIAQNRGMTPMNSEGIQQYAAATSESTSSMIALEKEEAANSPLNIMNQYSFIGSFARSLYPTSLTAKSSVSGAIASVGSVISQGFASLIKPVSAAQEFNPERYNKCTDAGYKELGINADVFCNVRYGLTAAELNMDTNTVVDFMINNGFITNSGKPATGKQYETFVKNCVEREEGWGEIAEENGSNGAECLDAPGGEDKISKGNLSYFRIYTLDSTINNAMDDEDVLEETTALVGKPDGAIDSDRGWRLANNVDYSQYECDPRTPEDSVYTDPNYGYTVRLCRVETNGGDLVASVVSTNIMNMIEKAKQDGIELAITDGMRKAGEPYYSSYTEHKYGVAVDLATPRAGQTICYGGDSRTGYGTYERAQAACQARGGTHYEAYKWLQANAESFGFYNYLVEPWHWSTSGR